MLNIANAHAGKAFSLFKIVEEIKVDKNLANLGKQMFIDVNLSSDKQTSCNSCHNISSNWTINKTIPTKGLAVSSLNPPTLLGNFTQGLKIANLEAEVLQSITSEIELNNSLENVLSYLNTNENYQQQFKAIFQREKITESEVAKAFIAYLQTIQALDSRFDKFLKNEVEFTEQEEKGLQYFTNDGCIACHNGSSLRLPIATRPHILNSYKTNNTFESQSLFRMSLACASLRHIQQTAPYLHDGSLDDLSEVVRLMYRVNLRQENVPNEKINDIVAFLNTL